MPVDKVLRTLAVALIAALMAVEEMRIGALRRALSDAHAHAAEAVEKFATERAAAVVAARAEEQRRDAAMRRLIDANNANAARLRADSARAADAAIRLRAQLAATAGYPATGHPGIAGDGAAAATATRVLTDVLGECVERVRALAATADASRAAGEQCAASYDALSQ